MTPLPISVVSTGDPLLRSTWSGTPSSICEHLRNLGRLGSTINAEGGIPRPLMLLARAVSRALYKGSQESSRGALPRKLRAWNVRRKLRVAGATHTLHIGTLHVPLGGSPNGQRHYLFCDATWQSWLRNSTSRHLYTARLIQDAERLERDAYSQMDHIFPIGKYVQRDLVGSYGVSPEKTTAVGTGRGAIQPFSGEKDYSEETILFVAKERFEDKGGDLLLKGFQIARERRNTLKLILAGDQRYVALAEQNPGVQALGYVSLAELQELFNRAALFALPAYNEPWGLVYLEALSCKTPILGLDRNAFPELSQYGGCGFSISDISPEGVAKALLDAFETPGLLREMGLCGQKYTLDNFTWEATVRRMVDIIDANAPVSTT